MNHDKLVDDVIELAFAVEAGDPIDWGVFKNGKDPLLRMLAASLVEQYNDENNKLIFLAVILKLVAENTILNTKLLSMEKNNEM
jgi:hypothetical protein